MDRRSTWRSHYRLLVLLGAVTTACGPDAPGAEQARGSSAELPAIGRADVEFVPGTVALEGAAAAAAVVSADDDRVVVTADAPGVDGLRAGGFLVSPQTGMRRIVRAERNGGTWELETTTAQLHEVVRDGTLEWSLPVSWDDALASIPNETRVGFEDGELRYSRPILAASVVPGIGATAEPGQLDFSGKVAGWDLSGSLRPKGSRLEYELKASRSTRGQKNVALSGTGWLSGFVSETLLTYEQSTPTRMTTKTTGLKGEIEIKWAAFMVGGQTMSEDLWLDLPFTVPIRFVVGPVPMQLNIMAKAQIVPTFVFDESSSGGSFKLTFDSDQGVSYDNQMDAPIGQLRNSEISVSGETVTASLQSASFGVGFEFPRLEVGPFGHAAMTFVTVKAFAAGTFISSSLKACQKGEASVRAIAGYRLWTPITSFAGQTEIWKKEFEKYRDNKKSCD